MATPKFNSKSPTIRRILREAAELSSSPSPDYTATPLDSDLFEWHFTLRGPPNSVYAEGIYHGRIVLPPAYPLHPPSFRFVTPSGRFEANREICLSISAHHEETWQPAWGVRTALVALRSFMETDARGQLGGLETTDAVRRRLAKESREWKCGMCGGRRNEEIMKECEEAYAAKRGGRSTKDQQEEEIQVPHELRLGYRDEMEAERKKIAAAAAANAGGREVDDEESAQLAEGFVQTAPPPPPPPAAEEQTSLLRDTALAPPPPVPVQATTPQHTPTRTIPLPAPPPAAGAVQGQLQQQRRVSNDDEVPVWIDRMIAIVGVVLAAMILKVFLGP
ncbi:ubiquitin-conjugating enzyme/RWD-like protein [Podospora didyma]|uniref:Ubiquitin-conjugating enzyme/RWD-like protein n=1 Tax=Podospora didyma TaxID=330526 RepID=A0AAE0KKW0_9PEZI|nr:ubiquitin-conjugating enzyme/RWD-like protein [Podospora didyma]